MKNNSSSFDTGFSATIKGISLFDYLQLLIMTKKNKTIEVRSDGHLGVIQLINGKVIFAKTSLKKTGNDAFCQIMSWKNGAFKDVNTNKVLLENVVDRGNLLLQAAEYMDKLENKKAENEVIDCDNSNENSTEFEPKEDFSSILEYNNDKKEVIHEQCQFFDKCTLFKICRSEGIKNMWIRAYCKSSNRIDCKRFVLLVKNKSVSETLLPNGKFLE